MAHLRDGLALGSEGFREQPKRLLRGKLTRERVGKRAVPSRVVIRKVMEDVWREQGEAGVMWACGGAGVGGYVAALGAYAAGAAADCEAGVRLAGAVGDQDAAVFFCVPEDAWGAG